MPRIPTAMDGRHLVVVLDVGQLGHAELLQVGLAGALARVLSRAGKDREEDRRQDGDNRDYHEQLDEGKTPLFPSRFHVCYLPRVLPAAFLGLLGTRRPVGPP